LERCAALPRACQFACLPPPLPACPAVHCAAPPPCYLPPIVPSRYWLLFTLVPVAARLTIMHMTTYAHAARTLLGRTTTAHWPVFIHRSAKCRTAELYTCLNISAAEIGCMAEALSPWYGVVSAGIYLSRTLKPARSTPASPHPSRASVATWTCSGVALTVAAYATALYRFYITHGTTACTLPHSSLYRFMPHKTLCSLDNSPRPYSWRGSPHHCRTAPTLCLPSTTTAPPLLSLVLLHPL